MLRLYSPSDEEVEAQLGGLLGRWQPLPARDVLKVSTVANCGTNDWIIRFIAYFGVVGTIAIACLTVAVTRNALALAVSFIFAAGFVIYIITSIGTTGYSRMKLGVFEQGMRLGRSVVRFDELKAITFGAPKTFAARNLPTFRAGQKKASRTPELDARRELGRKLALTMVRTNDKVVVWEGVGATFSNECLNEFFATLDAQAHSLLRGDLLTAEDRQKIADL